MSVRDPRLTELLDLLIAEVREHERWHQPGAAHRIERELDELHGYVTELVAENKDLEQLKAYVERLHVRIETQTDQIGKLEQQVEHLQRANEQLLQDRQVWYERYHEIRDGRSA